MFGPVTVLIALLTYILLCDFVNIGSVWMRVYHFHRIVDFYRPPINPNSRPLGE